MIQNLLLPAKRIAAFCIDYLIIAAYGAVLFFLNFKLNQSTGHLDWFSHPLQSQSIGLITLTLPVVLFFILFEKSRFKGTPGKKILELSVVSARQGEASFRQLLTRNFIKFLPWEIAHSCVHWSFFYAGQGDEIPVLLFTVNMLAMALALLMVIQIFAGKKNLAVYEKWNGTMVISTTKPPCTQSTGFKP